MHLDILLHVVHTHTHRNLEVYLFFKMFIGLCLIYDVYECMSMKVKERIIFIACITNMYLKMGNE
jgi:hypothetical protein